MVVRACIYNAERPRFEATPLHLPLLSTLPAGRAKVSGLKPGETAVRKGADHLTLQYHGLGWYLSSKALTSACFEHGTELCFFKALVKPQSFAIALLNTVLIFW